MPALLIISGKRTNSLGNVAYTCVVIGKNAGSSVEGPIGTWCEIAMLSSEINGNSVSWYATNYEYVQANYNGQTYYYIAIGKPIALIEFSIDGTTYQAIEDMLWGDWLNSEYNTDKYIFGPASNINTPDGAHAIYYDISTLSKTYDVIASGHSYISQ